MLIDGVGLDNDLERQIEDDNKFDNKIFVPINKEEFNYLKSQMILLRKNHKEEDVFIMKKAENSEVADVLYIHSCVDSIKKYIYNIRKKLVENLTVTYFV